MAVTAAQLLLPAGRLNPDALWPSLDEEDVNALLSAFIAEGATQAAADEQEDLDAATKLWAYYRAYLAKYEDMVATPASVETPNQGGHQYLVTQMTLMQDLANAALAEYNALLVVETITDTPPPGNYTRSVPLRHVW